MSLQKQNINLPFMGIDQKSDPFKIAPGTFLSLMNTVPIKGSQGGILIQKRNGFKLLPPLPDTTYKFLSTFKNSLVSIGSALSSLSEASQEWTDQGDITPIQLDTLPLVRTSSNQSQVDAAVAPNGLVCTVYTNDSPSTTYRYIISEVETGQNVIEATTIATPSQPPRVFLLGNYFIILFSQSTNLKYISIPISNPRNPAASTNLVTNYLAGALPQAFDGVVSNNNLYVAYNATDGGGAIRMSYLNSFLVRQTSASGTSVAAAKVGDVFSLCADETQTSPVIWVVFYDSVVTDGYFIILDGSLNIIHAAQKFINAVAGKLNIASAAQNGIGYFFVEDSAVYSYNSVPTHSIGTYSFSQVGVVVGGFHTSARSVGLASKAFIIDEEIYMLTAYSSPYQPSYFLQKFDLVTLETFFIVGKLSYSNGGGYLTKGLPLVTVTDSLAQMGYLIKDLLIAANKSQSPASQTPVYTQTGINLASFDLTTDGLNTSELGSNLNISGGILWTYDGTQIVEQGFNVYPDNVVITTATGAGNITAQDYYYQALYEWTDNQGNIHRSAPSLAVKQTTTTASSTNTINIPTLRLTYKTLVKIVLYRWSTTQQTYYQVTSIASPTLNNTGVDSIAIVDTLADSAIVGNSILYTTGGVIEDIGAPATSVMTLFKSRLFLVDAEDKNLIWYSKQVIESTPVEMSDLFTIFVAPTIGAQGDTGDITSLSAMDDKLIIFKKNAIYYITGTGPDNTGANNDFSDPIFVTSTVGCSDQNSIVFTPNGLQFKSDKGIWLLGRDLSTSYIGAPVEDFNEDAILSALSIPGTNQIRFTLADETIYYDYFFGLWGEFEGIPGISSTLYQSLHTFIDSNGRVFQELPGSYLDGSRPVLMSFQTGWFNFAGLQGYQRAYEAYLLGTFISPHKLNVQISYDYSPNPTQISLIEPENYNGPYGSDSLYGGSSPYGGNEAREQWRVFFENQQCEAFQLTVNEVFDPSFGTVAGAGLTLSGINLIYAGKKVSPRLQAAVSVG